MEQDGGDMSYNPNIPASGEKINASRPEIQENFNQIYNFVNVNHEVFDSAAGQGKHKFITFTTQAVAPAPGGTEIALYAATGTTGNTELFIKNGSTATTYQMTSARRNATNGWTMTPAGVLVKWGSATINSSSGGPFNFVWSALGTDIPFGTQFWSLVQIGADPGNTAKDVNAIAYVTSTANPAQVSYNVWRRNLFNTPGTNQQPFSVWVLAIGIP